MKDAAPIVVQAEAEDALPGLGLFIQSLKPAVMNARCRRAEGHVAAWNVARAIFEYAARADVQTRVDAMNRLPDGKLKPGRPKSAHGLAMDAIEAKGLVTRRALEKWVYEWYSPGSDDEPATGIAALLKVKPGCAEKHFAEHVRKPSEPEFVEDLLAKLAEQRGGDTDEPDLPPAKWAEKALKPLMRQFYDASGHPRALPKTKIRALAEQLDNVLEPFGWAVAPKAKH
ncbi:MAG: hypothetical protein AMXMBFR7_33240 [Planctomycetota bacterium]